MTYTLLSDRMGVLASGHYWIRYDVVNAVHARTVETIAYIEVEHNAIIEAFGGPVLELDKHLEEFPRTLISEKLEPPQVQNSPPVL